MLTSNKILLIILGLLVFSLFCPLDKILEHFNYDQDMLGFYRLDDSLIKKIKIGSSYSLYDQEVVNLFKNDSVIRMVVPNGYVARIIYKEKGSDKGFSKTKNFDSGYHDIELETKHGVISQIEARQEINVISGNNMVLVNDNRLPFQPSGNVIVTDRYGNIIYSADSENLIDWSAIYDYNGLDNYIVNYPGFPMRRKIFYHKNYFGRHPWRRYRHIQRPGFIYDDNDKYYKRRRDRSRSRDRDRDNRPRDRDNRPKEGGNKPKSD